MKSLLDWITDLEAEEFPKRLDRRIAREIRADFPTCLVRSTRGDPTSYCHHVERELVKIWNDVPFWEFLQGAPSENAVADYVRKKFGLALPPFARSVWLEMAKDIPNRKRLFDLLKSRPGTLPSLVPENAESDALEDLLDARLVNLFFDYLRAGRLDRKRALALLRFQPESYKILASAAAKLAKDAWWCAYELAKDTPVIPVETLIKKRGAPAKAEPIARLERLVQIAHEMPFATCYEMVRAYKISLGLKCEFKDEKTMRGLRDEAGVAKRLAEVRDGISVKHHIEDGIGRKPRRKNLGANAPPPGACRLIGVSGGSRAVFSVVGSCHSQAAMSTKHFDRVHTGFRVGRENIYWRWIAADQVAEGFLPRMQTDISLMSDKRKIIIDCKFTPKATQQHYEAQTLRSAHLYQINAYMDNLEGKWADTCEMMLLYPSMGAPISVDFIHKGHKIGIRAINLDQPWQSIHEDLLALVE